VRTVVCGVWVPRQSGVSRCRLLGLLQPLRLETLHDSGQRDREDFDTTRVRRVLQRLSSTVSGVCGRANEGEFGLGWISVFWVLGHCDHGCECLICDNRRNTEDQSFEVLVVFKECLEPKNRYC